MLPFWDAATSFDNINTMPSLHRGSKDLRGRPKMAEEDNNDDWVEGDASGKEAHWAKLIRKWRRWML